MGRTIPLFVAALWMFSAMPSACVQAQQSAAAGVSVPRLVQFNGTLKDSAARPVNGAASVTFAIYAEQDGGTPLWSETQNVIADANGHFNALLGGATTNGMPAELFGTGQSRWLGLTVARQPEMPRVLLASVPYALKAGDADTLGGLPASDYVTTKSLAASNARAVVPVVTSAANTTIIATPQTASAPAGVVSPDAIPQATPTGTGVTNFIPIWTSASVLGNSTIFESAGLVGIGTKTPAETLDVNGNSIFRGSFQLPPGHEAIASTGYESHSFQFQSSSFNSSTHKASDKAFGFRAEPLGNNTSNPSSKLDLFFGSAGGTLADTGFSWSSNGIVTFAPGQSFAGATTTVNEINLPSTTSPSVGVITVGGMPFLNDYGDPTDTFVGGQAGGAFKTVSQGVMSGGNITAVGTHSLFANTSGFQNTAVGSYTLEDNTSGTQNTAMGFSALEGSTTANSNTAFGSFAGVDFKAGLGNTFIGFFANTLTPSITNATAIGYDALVSQSNSLILGGNGSEAVNVGVGTPAPRTTMELLSANPSTFASPAATLTLSTQEDTMGAEAEAAIDFNTYAFETNLTNYNPTARIVAADVGNYSDTIEFLANKPGAPADGLKPTFIVDPFGNVQVLGSLYVSGSASITGGISKGSGTFKIDDPIDPANKYLSHSFVESPDMMNIYNGNIVTDASGSATVQLPAWFEALNSDFRYQLTVVGQFAQAIVGSEIQDGKFTIRTDKPNVKVSWMVTGVRHDPYAMAYRTPVEEAKPANEVGRYLHPELYGLGPEQAVDAANVLRRNPAATDSHARTSVATQQTKPVGASR